MAMNNALSPRLVTATVVVIVAVRITLVVAVAVVAMTVCVRGEIIVTVYDTTVVVVASTS